MPNFEETPIHPSSRLRHRVIKILSTLPIALDSRTRKMKRRNTRIRARTLRKDIKVVLMLVKSGIQAMKNPTRKVWHHSP